MAMPTVRLSGNLRVPGLALQERYRVSVLTSAENFLNGIVNTQPGWVMHGIELTGEWLAAVGVAMPVLDPETAILVRIEAQENHNTGIGYESDNQQ